LLCDYNRDGDSYRSPWSGEFEPSLDHPSEGGIGPDGSNEGAGEGAVPSERVRKMEIRANEAFDVYRELYYEGGVSSVYFWNLDDGFAGVVLLKKGARPPILLLLPPFYSESCCGLAWLGACALAGKAIGLCYADLLQSPRRRARARGPGTQFTSLRPSTARGQRITSLLAL
jgi:F-actin capping protein, beta subunit